MTSHVRRHRWLAVTAVTLLLTAAFVLIGLSKVVAFDATYTFGLEGPFGWRREAEELARATAVSLHGGGFARVVTTGEVVEAAG